VFLSLVGSKPAQEIRQKFVDDYNRRIRKEADASSREDDLNLELGPDEDDRQDLTALIGNDADFIQHLGENIRKSIYTIHIIDANDPKSLALTQQQLITAQLISSRSAFKTRILWFIDDTKQIRADKDGLNKSDADGVVDLLRYLERQRRKRIKELQQSDTILGNRRDYLLLYDSQKDEDAEVRKDIKRALERSGKTSYAMAADVVSDEDFKSELLKSHNAVFYLGECEPRWYKGKEHKILINNNLKRKIVCVDNPDSINKMRDHVSTDGSKITVYYIDDNGSFSRPQA